jgi:hypothetical protein
MLRLPKRQPCFTGQERRHPNTFCQDASDIGWYLQPDPLRCGNYGPGGDLITKRDRGISDRPKDEAREYKADCPHICGRARLTLTLS